MTTEEELIDLQSNEHLDWLIEHGFRSEQSLDTENLAEQLDKTRGLWCAVLRRVLEDIGTEHECYLGWFKSRDFVTCCEMAGVNPEIYRKEYYKRKGVIGDKPLAA
jgi:hypothetical protein